MSGNLHLHSQNYFKKPRFVEFVFQFLLLVLKDSQSKHKRCQNYTKKYSKGWIRERYGWKPQYNFFFEAVSARVDDVDDLSIAGADPYLIPSWSHVHAAQPRTL